MKCECADHTNGCSHEATVAYLIRRRFWFFKWTEILVVCSNCMMGQSPIKMGLD